MGSFFRPNTRKPPVGTVPGFLTRKNKVPNALRKAFRPRVAAVPQNKKPTLTHIPPPQSRVPIVTRPVLMFANESNSESEEENTPKKPQGRSFATATRVTEPRTFIEYANESESESESEEENTPGKATRKKPQGRFFAVGGKKRRSR